MSWSSIIGPAIGAAASLGSAYLGSQAANKAASQQAAAYGQAAQAAGNGNAEALQYLRESRDLSRGDLAPYQQAGLADYDAYRRNVGTSFQASPGYEFARQEGIRGIDQAASARGMLNSGGRLRELMRYGEGVANQEYNNWLNRQQGLAGVGQTASGQTASLAAGTGQQGANLIQSNGSTLANLAGLQGQARASGTTQAANALMGGINNATGLWALMQPSAEK